MLRNASPEWHPFHIHVNDFQVITLNGQPVLRNYNDTIRLPPHGEVVMRTRFTDITGKVVDHCHILGHEDAGMMGVVEVVEWPAGESWPVPIGARGAVPMELGRGSVVDAAMVGEFRRDARRQAVGSAWGPAGS